MGEAGRFAINHVQLANNTLDWKWASVSELKIADRTGFGDTSDKRVESEFLSHFDQRNFR